MATGSGTGTLLTAGENTWVTEGEADTYFATRFGASTYWDSGTDKTGALTQAYHDLNHADRWEFVPNSGDPATPEAWQIAQCEQALFLIMEGQGVDDRAAVRAQGVRQSKVFGEQYQSLRRQRDYVTQPSIAISHRAAAALVDYRKYGKGFKFSV